MENKKNMKKEIIEWIIMLIVAISLAFIIRMFIISTTSIQGESMEPTLKTSDKLFVNRIKFMVDNVKRGDIVEFHSPNNGKDDFIKRVIALEGDVVEIKDNTVYVNGSALSEEYTSTGGYTTFRNENYWEIKKDEIFVLGDNRPNSNDSRSFGPIKKNTIVGIAFFRYYPFNNMGVMKSQWGYKWKL